MSNRLCAITYWKICKDNPIKQVKYAPFCALTGAGVFKLQTNKVQCQTNRRIRPVSKYTQSTI